jgi:hypothetical protein
MDNQFANMSAFPQGMDFLKQMWAQGLAAQSAMPNMPVMGGASTAAAAMPSAPNAPGGMTQAFQQTMASYLMPTFDVAELDKRIGDMRTVLQFMDMNTNILRQTLQALEVQRNTVAALHSMMQPAADAQTTATTQASASKSASSAATAVAAKKAPRKTVKKSL